MVAETYHKIGIPADAELFLRVIVASILGYNDDRTKKIVIKVQV